MTRNQILALLVIILLAINTVSHISSPVYKFYKENISRIDKSNEQFRNEIRLELIPAITNLAFNLDNIPHVNISSSSSSSNSIVNSSLAPIQLPVRSLDFTYFVSDNIPFVSTGGFTFRVGDNFDSSPIVNISYYSFSTLQAIYQRGGEKNDVLGFDK